MAQETILNLRYRGTNLGDDVQTIAAMDLNPGDTFPVFVERDSLGLYEGSGKLVLNGWWSHDAENAWPPPPQVKGLPVSMHIAPKARPRFARKDSLEWFKANGPVGARDLETLHWLKSIGVDAYWSGCLTLTLKRKRLPTIMRPVLVDLAPSLVSKLDWLGEHMKATHKTSEKDMLHKSRLHEAEARLILYSSARLVVTSRLHVALPCLAIGTPVVLVGESIRFHGFEKVLPIATATTMVDTVARVMEEGMPEVPPEFTNMIDNLEWRVSKFLKDL